MESFVSPILLPKLRVPVMRPRTVPRARLTNMLITECDAKLVLVCAPAGYGKTTLLAEWAQALQQAGTAVAWYALDLDDNQPTAFASYLIASLIQAFGPQAELTQVAQILRSAAEPDLQRFLPSVINAVLLTGQECLLILDDYHLVNSPAIHSAVAYLLEHLPENLRVAIGSRSRPALPLARLRVRGKLLEIRAADLRFTNDETGRFLKETMRIELSPTGVSALEKHTEGWIAGLQLAALSLSGLRGSEQPAGREELISTDDFASAFTGGHRYLVEYLLEEVVDRLPEEVQSFLLSTSILERMCAPLCDAVLDAIKSSGIAQKQAGSSEAMLERLEQANLFIIALDDQGNWYRYHHLFRDFLLTQLKKTQPGEIAALYRAACEWLAGQGFLREAARHALQTRDWQYAAAFVEQHGFTLIVHSEISTLYEWCSAFPKEVIRTHPLIGIFQCWAWVFSFRSQNRARVEARLQQVDQAVAVQADRQIARGLSEHAAVVRIFLAMAPDSTVDPREQLALAQQMLGYYPEGEGDAGRFSALLATGYAYLALSDSRSAYQALDTARQAARLGGLFFGVVESTFHLARLNHSLGQLCRAAEVCREGQADISAMLPHPEQELPALGCLDAALGWVLIEQNQLAEAEQCLRRGLQLMGWGMNPYYMLTAHVAMFRLLEILGREEEALSYLDQLETTWPDIAFCTRGLRVIQSLRLTPDDPTTLAEATAWCLTYSPRSQPPGMGPFGAAEVYYLAELAWIEAQIATGSGEAAKPYLEGRLASAEANDLKSRIIELSLLLAELESKIGHQDLAFAALERAIALAQPQGYIRVFDRGPMLTQLLIEANKRGICQPYIDQILAAIQRAKPADPIGILRDIQLPQNQGLVEPAALIEPLSERELEVLRLIARGDSNQAIANSLVISIGTVKSHINHILGKLEAHSRTEAVARAREAGLI